MAKRLVCNLILLLNTWVATLILSIWPAYAGPGDIDLDFGPVDLNHSQVASIELQSPCEQILLDQSAILEQVKNTRKQVETIFYKYLLSQPVSKHILKSLIRAEFDVSEAADPRNSWNLKKRKEISSNVFRYFLEWFKENAEESPALDHSGLELRERLFSVSDAYLIKEGFLEFFPDQLNLYMRFLKASNVLFRPYDLIYETGSFDRPTVYSLLTGFSLIFAVVFANKEGMLPVSYFFTGVVGLLTGIPWVIMPTLTLAYEKTIGKYRGKKFLRKMVSREKQDNEKVKLFFYDGEDTPAQMVPQLPEASSLLPAESQRTLKDILDGIRAALKSAESYQQGLNAGVSLYAALKYDREFEAIHALLQEAENIVSKISGPSSEIDDLQEILLLEKDLLRLMDGLIQVGLEVHEQIKGSQGKRQPEVLGGKIARLFDELRPKILAQIQNLDAALEQIIYPHVEKRQNKQAKF